MTFPGGNDDQVRKRILLATSKCSSIYVQFFLNKTHTFLTPAIQIAQSKRKLHLSSSAVGVQQVFSLSHAESSKEVFPLPALHITTLCFNTTPPLTGLENFLHRSINVYKQNKTNSFKKKKSLNADSLSSWLVLWRPSCQNGSPKC